jgi:acyl-CoA synthetase (AMP-forming)/AMP-acid ligase II
MALNVAQLVLERARLRPASPAIITHEQVITYGRLGVAVGVVARHLREHGVTPGQIIGVSMGQNALHVITLLALAQIGAVSLPLHVAIPQARRLLAAERFGVDFVVSGRDDMALPGSPFISLANVSFDGSSIPPDSDIHKVSPDTPFRVALSSGTSGDPKGVMLTHGLMGPRIHKADHGLSALSRTMPMDLNFIVGTRPALSALAKGGALVMPVSTNADDLLNALVSHAVTHVYLSPAQAQSIVEPLATEGERCPVLQCLRIGGGSMSSDLLQQLRRNLSRNIYVSYGSTESGLVTYATPSVAGQKWKWWMQLTSR